ncbi:MAG: type II toxin-antitoxin system VapC family toxin [Acidobacteria bacterium]|nr:type II toxin-antitoxin system VapC family toxin [Acidobacteriota bacterium]
MRRVFADTLYWLAIFVPGDAWAGAARAADCSDSLLVTTEEVLSEFLTAVSAHGDHVRRLACRLVREILNDPGIDVVAQSHESFLAGLALYERRPDKEYSLTDCISMNIMRQRQIHEILTHDRHFAQEGFIRLLDRQT